MASWRQQAVEKFPPESGAPQPRSGERMGQWYLRIRRWQDEQSMDKLHEYMKNNMPQ